jgi:hypothetical protein
MNAGLVRLTGKAMNGRQFFSNATNYRIDQKNFVNKNCEIQMFFKQRDE